MLVASSVLVDGVKIPVQVLLSVLVINASAPFAFVTEMSSLLEKESTGSEKTSVTVAVSPLLSAVSSRVKELTEGSLSSTI